MKCKSSNCNGLSSSLESDVVVSELFEEASRVGKGVASYIKACIEEHGLSLEFEAQPYTDKCTNAKIFSWDDRGVTYHLVLYSPTMVATHFDHSCSLLLKAEEGEYKVIKGEKWQVGGRVEPSVTIQDILPYTMKNQAFRNILGLVNEYTKSGR